MSSVEHNIKKNIEEAAWMAELSVSIPALTINWTKSESPDWISDSGIGIEITNLTSANSREIFDYKNPIKHTLREVAGIDYKTDGLGVYETESGE